MARSYDDWKTDSDEIIGPVCHHCRRNDVELSPVGRHGRAWVCTDCSEDDDQLYQEYCDRKLER